MSSLAPLIEAITRWRVFVFSVVREPTARAISEYYHFHVFFKKESSEDAAVIRFLNGTKNVMFNYLKPHRDATAIREIFNTYDFIGTVELYHESMVALATRLGLPLLDVLFVSAVKNSARQPKRSNSIPRSSSGVRAWMNTGEFESHAALDFELWREATFRLEAVTGERKFQVERYADLAHVATGCNVRGTCYWKDAGCGYPCLDQRFPVIASLYEKSRTPNFVA
jgi:hypothetical protein